LQFRQGPAGIGFVLLAAVTFKQPLANGHKLRTAFERLSIKFPTILLQKNIPALCISQKIAVSF